MNQKTTSLTDENKKSPLDGKLFAGPLGPPVESYMKDWPQEYRDAYFEGQEEAAPLVGGGLAIFLGAYFAPVVLPSVEGALAAGGGVLASGANRAAETVRTAGRAISRFGSNIANFLRIGTRWTPEMTRQLSNATEVFRKGPLTNVGRALTKHPNIIGESGNILQKLGGAQNVNAAAARALENIMRQGTITTKMTKAFGNVVQYTLESGVGARFSAETGEFIGFLGRGL